MSRSLILGGEDMKVKTKERIKLILAIVIFIVLFGVVGTWDMECRQTQLGVSERR